MRLAPRGDAGVIIMTIYLTSPITAALTRKSIEAHKPYAGFCPSTQSRVC